MKLIVSSVVAGLLAVTAASLHATDQGATQGQQQSPAAPAQPQTTPAAPQAGGQQVTMTGCIQSEADYRRARDAGRGGVAGTGLGAGNEFVLVNASMASGAAAGQAVGTSGA